MKIAIASDHAGLKLKEYLVKFLQKTDCKVQDLGAHKYDENDDYSDFARAVAQTIQRKDAERGILLCGSGVGVCIAANKFKGIRAAICHDTYSAKQGVEHDGMNVLCLGARIITEDIASKSVQAFLNAFFINETRFVRRLNKVIAIEKE